MARTIQVAHYDAFSVIPNKGDPARIVFDADHLTDTEMQSIAFVDSVGDRRSDVGQL